MFESLGWLEILLGVVEEHPSMELRCWSVGLVLVGWMRTVIASSLILELVHSLMVELGPATDDL